MRNILISCIVVALSAAWTFCQTTYSSGNDGTGSSTGTPVCTGSCVANFNHSGLTGEAYYKAIVLDLANSEAKMDCYGEKYKNLPQGNQTGYYLSQVILATKINDELETAANMTGAECLAVNALGKTIDQLPQAFDVVPGNCSCLTGENYYASKLHAIGAALLAVIAVNDSNPYPGPYLTMIHNLVNGLDGTRTAVANNDSSQNCITQTILQATSRSTIVALADPENKVC